MNLQFSIDLLKAYEPPEGYWVAFSGGKDSVCLAEVVRLSGVKYELHYNPTGIDPPEVVRFIRDHYPQTVFEKPLKSITELIVRRGLPTRLSRLCCQYLKEHGGENRAVVLGIRKAESLKRSKRCWQEQDWSKKHKKKLILNPILDWSDKDVWSFIRERKLPYCSLYDEGFKRLGCVLCPMSSNQWEEMRRWPKLAHIWYLAAKLSWERQTPGMKKFKSVDELFLWWLTGEKRNGTEPLMDIKPSWPWDAANLGEK